MWLWYGIIGGITAALGALYAKKAVSYIKDPWMRSFYFSAVVCILVFPFFLYEFSLPKNLMEVGLILLTSAALVIGNYFSFKSYNYLNPSSINIIGKIRLIWVALVGILFLKQILLLKDVFGMILILIASIIIVDYKNLKINYQGLIAVIISTLPFAVFAYAISILSKDIAPFSVLFFISITPALMNWIVIRDWKNKFVKTYSKTKILIIGAIFSTIYNMCMVLGVREEPTKVFFILETGIIVIVIGEYFWMKDKKNLLIKILAVALAIAGAILLR